MKEKPSQHRTTFRSYTIWIVGAGLLVAFALLVYRFRFLSSGPRETTTVPVAEYIQAVKPRLQDRYDSKTAFFVDLTRPSSEYRFFVLDLENEKVLSQGMACNGVTDSNGRVVYSNVPGSNCSSRGLYRVGGVYTGRFGKAYKLHGLDSTNNNAFKRAVVLHGHLCVPAQPLGLDICESQGCPTVNPAFLDTLTTYIKASPKPLLLCIN